MPLVQERAVNLPPVVTLTAQVLFGVLLGLPGIVFATPLAAVILVLVKMLYVEDTLGDPIGEPGQEAAGSGSGQRRAVSTNHPA